MLHSVTVTQRLRGAEAQSETEPLLMRQVAQEQLHTRKNVSGILYVDVLRDIPSY